jgi:hypothetical protein
MKKYLLGLVIVIVAAVFVTVPSQALQKGEMPDRAEKQAKIQADLDFIGVIPLITWLTGPRICHLLIPAITLPLRTREAAEAAGHLPLSAYWNP